MATLGSLLTTVESGYQRIDDTDSKIQYFGTDWVNETGYFTNRFGTTTSCLKNPTSSHYIKFKFYGTKLRLYGAGYASMNTGNKATIDGVDYTMVLWSSITSDKIGLSLDVVGLPLGMHDVTIVHNGSARIYLDCIDIDSTGYLINMRNVIISCDDKTVYPNVYIDKDNVVKFNVNYPTQRATVTDSTSVTQSSLEGGLLFETEFLDLTKYSNITGIVMK